MVYFPKIYAGMLAGLRNCALPPRSGYETLRDGALGSGDGEHFLMPDNDTVFQ